MNSDIQCAPLTLLSWKFLLTYQEKSREKRAKERENREEKNEKLKKGRWKIHFSRPLKFIKKSGKVTLPPLKNLRLCWHMSHYMLVLFFFLQTVAYSILWELKFLMRWVIVMLMNLSSIANLLWLYLKGVGITHCRKNVQCSGLRWICLKR